MNKLNLNALKEKAGAIASEELLSSINGGTENGCHADDFYNPKPTQGPINDSNDPWVR